VPKVNTKKNFNIYRTLEKVINKELIASSISVNSGGLVVALVKASIGGMLGVNVDLKNLKGKATTIDAKLFSESQGRIVVSVAKKNIPVFEKVVKGIPFTKIGTVSEGKNFVVKDGKKEIIKTKIQSLSKAYNSFSNKYA